LVESTAADSLTYLQRFQEEHGGRDFMRPTRDARDDLIDTLRAQLASIEAQLAEAREALDALRAAQTTVERTDTAGASTSRGVLDPKMTSLWEQLAAAVARAEVAERNLTTRTALSQATLASAEWVEERGHDRSWWIEERSRWEEECRRWSEERERLTQQAVEARTSLGVSEQLLREAEERYRRGREHAVREGRASAYFSNYLVASSQYRRNVQEERAAQGSTDSKVDPSGFPFYWRTEWKKNRGLYSCRQVLLTSGFQNHVVAGKLDLSTGDLLLSTGNLYLSTDILQLSTPTASIVFPVACLF
ncbi:hypothetical protein Taro_045464, partial [Colocasia esculenta]|nr:hypothetical protein [Colocasia esculenta]